MNEKEQAQSILSKNLVLGELLARSSRKFPEKTALVFGEKRYSYRQLNNRVNGFAHALLSMHVGKLDKVAILLQNCSEMVECYFACNKIGAVAVPVNFRLAEMEVRYVLEHSDATVLVFEDAFRDLIVSLKKTFQQIHRWIHIGDTASGIDGVEEYEELISGHSSDEPMIPVGDSDDAFIMYTSGTTGRPKGAVLTHKNLFVNTTNWIIEVGADVKSVWVSGLQLFHIGGLDGILPFVYLGGSNVLLGSTRFDAETALKILEREKATHCYFVPSQWQELINSPGFKKYDLSRLRVAMWGASMAPDSLLEGMAEKLPNASIINAFGQTEMSSNTTFLKGNDARLKLGSAGKPVVNLEVRIVDEHQNDVRAGDVGEIIYRGPTVLKEYYKDPEATANSLEGGWFHSGDLVRQDEDGFIYVVDRKKDMIISGGENIYPAELERILHGNGKIKEAAVIGVPHPKWVETPLAVVVLRPGESATEEEIIGYCKEHLASYKKPSRVLFIESLPRNASGKVLKTALREKYNNSPTICEAKGILHPTGYKDRWRPCG